MALFFVCFQNCKYEILRKCGFEELAAFKMAPLKCTKDKFSGSKRQKSLIEQTNICLLKKFLYLKPIVHTR